METTAARDLRELFPNPRLVRPRLWTLVLDPQPTPDGRMAALVRLYYCEESHVANVTRDACAVVGAEYDAEKDAARMVGYFPCVLPAEFCMSLARALYGDALAIAFEPL